MDLAAAIVKQPWFRKLDVRSSTYFQMMKHLDGQPDGLIIETGTAWHRDNWSGQGQSTLIWDWVLSQRPGMHCLSIDLSQEHIDSASSQTKFVDYLLSDSVRALNEMGRGLLSECRLLYLDSFDWHEDLDLESAFHHMAELACVWPLLPSGCMIAVDDRHGAMRGKHWLVEAFLKKLGIEPVFIDYQIGWIKP